MTEKAKPPDGAEWLKPPEERRPIVTRQAVVQYQQGPKVATRVTGPEEEANEFLANLRMAFVVYEGDENAAKGESDDAVNDELRPDLDALVIEIGFLEVDGPHTWKLAIDPHLNVGIAGTARHLYIVPLTSSITAELEADFGTLKMTLHAGGEPSVTVSGGSANSVSHSSSYRRNYWISVDGLEANNRYDLYLSG